MILVHHNNLCTSRRASIRGQGCVEKILIAGLKSSAEVRLHQN
jgi:hypothetical protein